MKVEHAEQVFCKVEEDSVSLQVRAACCTEGLNSEWTYEVSVRTRGVNKDTGNPN